MTQLQQEHACQTPGERLGRKLDILVVEDDPEINELVGAYVEILGFGYLPSLTGNDALRLIATRRPAMVILDVMLPDVDGFEVCQTIKRDAATRDIPVLMLTALDRPELRQRGLQCGASDYMTKPFDPDRLLAAIRSHLPSRDLAPQSSMPQ